MCFTYERFITCSGHALVAFMEPLLAQKSLRISENEISKLMSGLSRYDEYHLVYALLLCFRHSPERALNVLPNYLADNRDSVFCAALNCLREVRDEWISSYLLRDVQVAIDKSRSRKEAVTDLFQELKKRAGTNDGEGEKRQETDLSC